MDYISDQDLIQLLGIPFSEEQLAAITAPLAPGLIEAAAGSGKTTVMAARVVWLVATGQVLPDEILGLTFTRKATAELATRIRSALARAGWDDTAGLAQVMTYDAFAAALVQEYAVWLGGEVAPRQLEAAARYQLAAEVVAQAASDGGIGWERLSQLAPSSVAEQVLALDQAMKSNLVDEAALRQSSADFCRQVALSPTNNRGEIFAVLRDAAQVTEQRLALLGLRQAYDRLKTELAVVEYADQLAAAIQLVRQVPQVRADYARRFKVVLLDEYQDTSVAQGMLMAELFAPAVVAKTAPALRPGTESGVPPPGTEFGVPPGTVLAPDAWESTSVAVTAVGDPFQAIYGWRGASANSLADFRRAFAREGQPVRHDRLTINRRSDRAILDAANAVAEPLRQEAGAAGNRLQPAALAAAGQVVTAGFMTWDEEVAWLADRIAAAWQLGEVTRLDQIAVLCRRNRELGSLYEALSARDIPVEMVGLGGLLQVPEIADLVAQLRLIDNPESVPDLLRLLSAPRWGLSQSDLAYLGQRAQQLAAEEVVAGQSSATIASFCYENARVFDPYSGQRSAPRSCAERSGVWESIYHPPIPSLRRALADPGPDCPVPLAEKLAWLDRELTDLSRLGGLPLVELLARVERRSGLNLELASRRPPRQAAARRQLAAFREAVAAYASNQPADLVPRRARNLPNTPLAGLIDYLAAEAEHGLGLERAIVSGDNSVKLLTMHRAKGLEWDIVYLPGLAQGIFPGTKGVVNPLTNAAALPHELRADAAGLPRLEEVTRSGADRFRTALQQEAYLAEDRLAYVAVTRARHLLVASSHYWEPGRQKPRRPSPYFLALEEVARSQGRATALPEVAGETNPQDQDWASSEWPVAPAAELLATAELAELVNGWIPGQPRLPHAPEADRDLAQAQQELVAQLAVAPAEVQQQVRHWQQAAERLLAEATTQAGQVIEVTLPTELTASQVILGRQDPSQLAAQLARPWPRRPSTAGRQGRAFHAWVEAQTSRPALIDADFDLPVGQLSWRQAFSGGRFGQVMPCAVEYPFTVGIGGHQIRGRIDAVFDRDSAAAVVPAGADYLVVDWKTGHWRPDPLQLSIYRLAWAEARGIEVDRVAAGFYYVAEDRLELAELPEGDLTGQLNTLVSG